MKRRFLTIVISFVLVASWLPLWTVRADSLAPSLIISQFKITASNGQFFTLYNPGSSSLDMSKYQLEYFNNYDLSKATSSKLIDLSGSLPAHGYFMVSDDSLLLCYQLTVEAVSLGLSSTAGMVQLLQLSQSGPGGSVVPQLEDYVAWTKTATSGAQTLPSTVSASLRRLPLDSKNNPVVSVPGSGSWQTVQPDATNPCSLVTTVAGKVVAAASAASDLLPPTEPPATIVMAAAVIDASTATLPATDVGLRAPEITELLPNPAGTGTDATNEFAELYNPNNTDFDLTGFELQAGTTVQHTYIFPAGASLPAQSFIAFYSSQTGLSLSNSGGQAKLINPLGDTISSSAVYGTAGDGQAWALAKGTWYWTTTPTPSAANVINQPPSSTKKKSRASNSKSSSKSKGSVKAAKTAKPLGPTAAATASTTSANSTPIHAWTLALVAGLALLYGAYEYRADLGNYFFKLRNHRAARRANRP